MAHAHEPGLAERYRIAQWGAGYFSVDDEGFVRVHPTRDATSSVRLKMSQPSLVNRGIAGSLHWGHTMAAPQHC